MTISRESVLAIVSSIESLLKMAKMLSVWFPKKVNPALINTASAYLEEIKPYLNQPWVYEIVNDILGLFHKGVTPAEIIAVLQKLGV